VFVTERLRFAAHGLFGGGPGAKGEVLIDGGPVDTRRLQVLRKGSVVTIRTPGGGGYGVPDPHGR
jgi:N-methylhydantoinase B/oxoprolinase/acetone carboxylase alpha subunit